MQSDNYIKKRYKIKMFQRHFANIDAELLKEFNVKTGIINIIPFIKEIAYKDYGIYLEDIDSLRKFDNVIIKDYYRNRTDWLRVKMRDKIIETRNKEILRKKGK